MVSGTVPARVSQRVGERACVVRCDASLAISACVRVGFVLGGDTFECKETWLFFSFFPQLSLKNVFKKNGASRSLTLSPLRVTSTEPRHHGVTALRTAPTPNLVASLGKAPGASVAGFGSLTRAASASASASALRKPQTHPPAAAPSRMAGQCPPRPGRAPRCRRTDARRE